MYSTCVQFVGTSDPNNGWFFFPSGYSIFNMYICSETNWYELQWDVKTWCSVGVTMNKYCIHVRGGFIFANFASQSSQKFPLQYMANVYSNGNITNIAKLSPREFPHLVQSRESICTRNIWRITYSNSITLNIILYLFLYLLFYLCIIITLSVLLELLLLLGGGGANYMYALFHKHPYALLKSDVTRRDHVSVVMDAGHA